MYLGMALVLFGMAIILGFLTPFFITPLFIILINQIFIKFEERKLEEKFGRQWLEYSYRVRRWI